MTKCPSREVVHGRQIYAPHGRCFPLVRPRPCLPTTKGAPMIARTGSACASGRTAVPRHTNHATVNQNARDLNSPNELRHAQLTRKFVRKQPVFTSERTSRQTGRRRRDTAARTVGSSDSRQPARAALRGEEGAYKKVTKRNAAHAQKGAFLSVSSFLPDANSERAESAKRSGRAGARSGELWHREEHR